MTPPRSPIWLYRLLIAVALIALWWLAALWVSRNVIPSPIATANAAVNLLGSPKIYLATRDTILIYLGGLALAALIGLPVGLLAGGIPALGRTLDPFFNAFMATPRVAFIPLIIVLLGLGAQAKIAIVTLGAVMPILVNTYTGVRYGNADLMEMARSLGGTRLQVFGKILLPGATPFIMAGLRLGATIGLINTVVAELYTAVSGLGGMLATYGGSFQMAPYFVVVLILSVLGVAITEALRAVERRLEHWRQ